MPQDPIARRKLDPRLRMLQSMGESERDRLKAEEDAELAKLAAEIRRVKAALDAAPETRRGELLQQMEALEARVFGPLTTGLLTAQDASVKMALQSTEAVISAFIVCDGSREDLEQLGVKVRSQAGSLFTAFIRLSVIPRLESSAAVHYIELARPVFPTLNIAVHNAQIDALRVAPAHNTGAGVVVAIIDSTLDIHHPDFRNVADESTRIRFLWDQTLTPQGGEQPPTSSTLSLPGYGVEYGRAQIDAQLAAFTGANAYTLVRHNAGGEANSHGTHVAGIAAGGGRAATSSPAPYIGAAPEADIIFVATANLHDSGELADLPAVADAFAYAFARASELNQACVVNMSNGDNLGPHDGSSAGERFLDALLEVAGRAITLSAGNSTGTACHATGTVIAAAPKVITLECLSGANRSDALEIWYDGQDRFDVTVTVPGAAAIGPVSPGNAAPAALLPGGVQVFVTSVLDHPLNGDNCISIIFVIPAGQSMPLGTTRIELRGTALMNGVFHAWVDRNNRTLAGAALVRFTSDVDETSLTLGSPGTARRPLTVGNHTKALPPTLVGTSGCGPTRDGRVKPEIAAAGDAVMSPYSRNRNGAGTGNYSAFFGTSASAPLVAGACACLFQCRGAATTWAQLKQIFEDTAGTTNITVPDNGFGFGYVQIATGCSRPVPIVDVWLRDDAGDTGIEPFTGSIAWLSPDIEVLDSNRVPVGNPTHAASNAVNNIIRITVRNRGGGTARNTEVHFYWADPATNIPYPSAWNASGIYTGIGAGFVNQANTLVIPELPAGQSKQVEFGWAPPAPGANIRGDDHFCLLVRLETPADPSHIGAGGWSAVATRNNIALRNVHVQDAPGGNAGTSFYVVGTGDQDSLTVIPDLAGGEVRLHVPIQALPWRELRTLETMGTRRALFTGRRVPDALAELRRTLNGPETEMLTGIRNARGTVIADGIAVVTLSGAAPLHVPDVRLAEGARLVAAVSAIGARAEGEHCFIHVAQRSGGQLAGGISLRLRPA
jgi:hypothetical protein